MSYRIRVLLAFGLGFAALCTHAVEVNTPRPPDVKVVRFLANSQIELVAGGNKATLQLGEHLGPWTFVGLVPGKSAESPKYAVVEDFTHQDGHLLFVDTRAVQVDLPKSLEPTSADPGSLYLGHTLDEIMNSASDLLGNQILSEPGDPDYQEIARVFPPIRKIKLPYSFVGTPDVIDKVGFLYGGRTPDFDPAVYYPPINQIRDQGRVWDGLVGGYLPVLRFVYPESPGNWTEMIAFAPLRISNGNNRIQPVWYRVCRIENGTLKWTRCIDSYHPFPPRLDYDPNLFYTDLAELKSGWDGILQQSMKIVLPDERVANMARFSLVRAIMTRVGDYPKYGAFDKDYAGSEHDGFPDTFTVETAAMLNWGLVDRAGRYIDNYFGKFVRDDGSILYRGPETGQYGRMLTVVAQYANLGGDPAVLLKRRSRIDGVTKLLLALRSKALTLPASDPAYGMIAGWSEADACLDPAPARYMQPYFSNSTEAARGFRDLGMVWEALGRKNGDAELMAWGQRLVQEAAALRKDIDTAISRSLLTIDGETILPCIAGVKEPFHVAVPRDPTDPQYRSYRAYMEMMYSGSLTREQVRMIFAYCSNHHDVILGVPTAYGYKTGELAGFLSYGYGYGLIQMDMIREALLMMYSDMAHQYTRGTWTAPETRNVLIDKPAEPYCTPSQLVVALMTRWLLVFEDPESNTLWLCKAVPRTWLEDGKTTAVSGAATKWGRVGFSVVSHIKAGTIAVQIDFPTSGMKAATNFRLRVPGEKKLKSIILNGKAWTQFDTATETINFPAGMAGTVTLVAQY
ncbi:MAG TPA: hypothetical protein VJT54_15835 [Verrucomicrobiae bacterium]|nr:hypothetical protein [Verrucomicrobiae bacterium]